MTKKSPVVVIDADALVAQVFPDDANHEKAVKFSQLLADNQTILICPVTAILEATTVLQKKLNNGSLAHSIARAFLKSGVKVEPVNDLTLQRAVKIFESTMSKQDTLFDCVVLAIAKEKHADAIFSFDKFYISQGFSLVT